MDRGENGDQGKRLEHAGYNVLTGGPAKRGQAFPFLPGEALSPARECVAFGICNPELGEAADHLKNESMEFSLGAEQGAKVAKLPSERIQVVPVKTSSRPQTPRASDQL